MTEVSDFTKNRAAQCLNTERLKTDNPTSFARAFALITLRTDCYAYASIGKQAHTKLRSPQALSTRPTGGQYLLSRKLATG